MTDLVLRRVRVWPRESEGGRLIDVLVRDGHIANIVDASKVSHEPRFGEGSTVIDGQGGVLLPALADVHAHLDSTRLGLPFRPHTAAPGLAGLIENDRANWRTGGETVAARAERTLGVTIAAGATLIRTHVQVDSDAKLERLEGVLAAREAHTHRADIEIVAFPQSGIVRDPPTRELLEAAVEAGADLVGGIDPCAFDRDPVAHLDVVFSVAERRHVGVDIHLHEVGELGAFTFELIAERTKALGMNGKVTISHAFALSSVDASRQGALIDLLARNDIAVTTVAPGNREPLPLELLRAAGVRVGLGQDGIRDYWSPYGNGDMLERAWQLAFRAGYRRDDAIEMCVDVACRGGRSVAHGGSWSTLSVADDGDRGLAVGARADLVVVPAETVTAAVMDHPSRTAVIHRGRVVALDGALA